MYNREGKKLNQNWLSITLTTRKYYEGSNCTKSLPPGGLENLGKRLASLNQNEDLGRLKLRPLRREPCWAGAVVSEVMWRGWSWKCWENFNSVQQLGWWQPPWMILTGAGSWIKLNGRDIGSSSRCLLPSSLAHSLPLSTLHLAGFNREQWAK